MKRPALAALITLAGLAPNLALRAQMTEFTGDAGGEFRTLNDAEAAKVLAKFRDYRARGDQRMRFTITHTERRSDEDTRYAGELCATRGETGMITRIEIRREGAPASTAAKFLIIGGASPAVYTLGAAGAPTRADADSLKPLLPGLVFTPYDLQLPFIHWPDFRYLETERFRTRPTDYFRMQPDPAFHKARPEISAVTLGFDRAYNALMRAQTLDEDGRPLRDLRAESFGKIRGEWIIRAMKLRDEKTRETDIFEVDSAALGLAFPADTFTPKGLASTLPHTPESAFSKAD